MIRKKFAEMHVWHGWKDEWTLWNLQSDASDVDDGTKPTYQPTTPHNSSDQSNNTVCDNDNGDSNSEFMEVHPGDNDDIEVINPNKVSIIFDESNNTVYSIVNSNLRETLGLMMDVDKECDDGMMGPIIDVDNYVNHEDDSISNGS